MIKTFKNIFLQNHKADDLGARYVALTSRLNLQAQQIVSERIDPHHFVLKPKISKKSHDQLRMDNRGVSNGSHDSGNAA